MTKCDKYYYNYEIIKILIYIIHAQYNIFMKITRNYYIHIL